MYSLFFILYFCIAHLIFIDQLIINGDSLFKQNLIKSYLWPYMFITWIYQTIYNLLINSYDWCTDKWEDFKFLYWWSMDWWIHK